MAQVAPVQEQQQTPGIQYTQTAFAPPAPNTTVIINQPTPGSVGPSGRAPRMWTTGLCSMCDDVGICLCGMCCGCWLLCKVSSDMGESICLPCLVPASHNLLRTKWRTQENIQGSILDDCLTILCCAPCALCQLAREVKAKRNGTLPSQ